MRDVRLGGFLGKEAKDDKPKQALFWRSGKTVDALAGNLDGMKMLLEASKLAGALPADQAWMGKEALFEFSNAARAAASARGRSPTCSPIQTSGPSSRISASSPPACLTFSAHRCRARSG